MPGVARGSLWGYRRDYYSQNGEDGVIAELLRRLGITRGLCVEFGAWDGKRFSNTYHLIESTGWTGLYIEADPGRFADLLRNEMVVQGKIIPVRAFVAATGEDTLDHILARHNIPEEFELLSIDVDGDDLSIWASLKGYRPKIVVIEIDSSIEPTRSRTLPDGRPEKSFANMLRLGRDKGYTLVCHTGNMVFVANELVARLGMGEELAEPEKLFCDKWMRQRNSRLLQWRARVAGRIQRMLSQTQEG